MKEKIEKWKLDKITMLEVLENVKKGTPYDYIDVENEIYVYSGINYTNCKGFYLKIDTDNLLEYLDTEVLASRVSEEFIDEYLDEAFKKIERRK